MCPSEVVSVLASTARIWASTIRLPRSFPIRSDSVGTPSTREIVAYRMKTTRAVGRENFAKTSPVDSAVTMSPTIDSATTTQFAAKLSG